MNRSFATLAGVAILAGCASAPREPVDMRTETVDAPSLDAPEPVQPATLNDAALAHFTPTSPVLFVAPDAPFAALPVAPPADVDPDAIQPARLARLASSRIADPWLPARAWRSADAHEQPGATLLIIPSDALAGRDALTIGTERVRIARVARTHAAPALASLPGAYARFAPALSDASQRWRARLALESFGLNPSSLGTFDDDSVEAFATALELRARAAIEALRDVDAATGERLARTLGRTLTFPGGVIAPAWPDLDASFEDVVSLLLNPSAPREAATDRARQWLDAQPRAVAWIDDDAGLLGARALIAELAGVADLARARMAPTATCDPATLHPVLARSVAEIQLKCRARPAARTMRLDVGQWSTALETLAAPAEVSPPGVRVGPFTLPHSMRTLLAGQVAVPDAAHATAALIQRRPGADAWQIYAECLAPPDDAPSEDVVRFFFGPREAPNAVLAVRATGVATLTTFDTGGPVVGETAAVVRRDADRWIVFADLPAQAVSPDGVLLVGAERVDARGVRSVWPRPTLPWQDEPPRAAFDLSTWAPLGAK